MENVFNNIYGYENIKEELLLIRDWLKDESLVNNNKLSLVKGILFYGDYGCGKTLFMKEYAKCFDCPIYKLDSSSMSSSEKDIRLMFSRAKTDSFAIILIDEIDLIIQKDLLSYKILKEEMDGIETKGRILVMATTNNIKSLPDPLLRPGRFDRKIYIDLPNINVRIDMFKKYMDKLKMNYSNIDFDILGIITSHCKCSDINAITNDAFLFAKNQPTTDDFSRSYERIMLDSIEDNDDTNKLRNVAVHEVGHMLMGLRFKENFKFYNIKFNKFGGETIIHPIDEEDDSITKRKQSIMIALSGHIAEKLIFKKDLLGSSRDFKKAEDLSRRLIERTCIKSLKDFLGCYDNNDNRFDPNPKRRKIEKRCEKLLKELEKETYNYLKTKINKINYYADILMKNGSLMYKDIRKEFYER